jgi:hypothetical protein
MLEEGQGIVFFPVLKLRLLISKRMIRFEDRVMAHRFYRRALKNIVEIYLAIADNPILADKRAAEEAALGAPLSRSCFDSTFPHSP